MRKKEPCEKSFNEIDYKIITETPAAGDFQSSRHLRENSTKALGKCDGNQENELDDLRIELECREQKPILNLPAVKKMEDHSKNHLKGIEYCYDYHTLNMIKVETAGVVKKESFDEDPTNGLSEPNQKRRVDKKLIYERGSKTHIDSTHDRIIHTCDTCGKTYAHKKSLKLHIDSVHNKITPACKICKKTFKHKVSRKIHLDIHNGLKEYKCDLCDKKYTRKSNLQNHIDSAHNKVTHSCDICGNKYPTKADIAMAHR
uniref:C2H2-type domain-containing protein n=1 Tax=Trichogramma kaykai TaxID=54128 RepID=A0ABD2WVX3_9HYME